MKHQYTLEEAGLTIPATLMGVVSAMCLIVAPLAAWSKGSSGVMSIIREVSPVLGVGFVFAVISFMSFWKIYKSRTEE